MTYSTNNPHVELCPECSGRLVPFETHSPTSLDPLPRDKFVCLDCEARISPFGGPL